MQKISDQLRSEGKTIGFVPTMGFLHEGHLSLIRNSRDKCEVTVVSIFVNPTQFAPTEDFSSYPRNPENDEKLLIEENVDYLFCPDTKDIYPEDYQSFVEVEKITKILEGEFRPTHFKGVTTIVSVLFNIVKPHYAFFGQKDAQQCVVIKQMVKDLKFDLEIIISPVVREADGLAMSSRNIYLSENEREKALLLYKSLLKAKETIEAGEIEVKKIIRNMNVFFAAEKNVHLNYIRIVEAETFAEIDELEKGKEYFVLIAAKVGRARLIDNIIIKPA